MGALRKTWRTIGIAAGVVALVGGFAGADSRAEVVVQLFQFRPGSIAVTAGTRVAWVNQDDITHTVTSGTPEQRDGRFDVVLDGKGASGAVQFREPGVHPYFCGRHRSMRGEIRVN